MGDTSKGMTKLKKRVIKAMWPILLEVGNITNYPFLEKDHPSRDIGEGSKPTEPKAKEEKDEED